MANPQVENGHIDIANELGEALARTCFNATESRLIWAILRQTYGWHKKIDRISYTQFERLTGLSRRHIGPGLKRLISRHIVKQVGNGHKLSYGIQKNYELWLNVTYLGNDNYKTLPTKVTNENVTYLSNTPLPTQVTKTLPTQVKTKENKETIQKKEDSFNKNIITDTTTTPTPEEIRRANLNSRLLKDKTRFNSDNLPPEPKTLQTSIPGIRVFSQDNADIEPIPCDRLSWKRKVHSK